MKQFLRNEYTLRSAPDGKEKEVIAEAYDLAGNAGMGKRHCVLAAPEENLPEKALDQGTYTPDFQQERHGKLLLGFTRRPSDFPDN